MPFLEVLTPSGHRNKVEVNNNTILISVLEDVCYKRKLNVDFCYLMYNKTKLDLSAKFGMSKLLNNSKLELIISPISLTENMKLEITLQIPNGVRLTNNFTPNDSLWTVLTKSVENNSENEDIFPKDSDLTPVLFHMHDQLIGEYCLQNTSLASLGFRSGRVLFRFELKKISNEEIECVRKVIDEKLQRKLNCKEEYSQTAILNEHTEIHKEFIPSIETFNVRQNFVTPNEHRFSNEFSPFSVFPSNEILPVKQKEEQKPKKSSTLGELLGINLEHDNVYIPTENFMNFKFPEETAGKNLMEIDEKPNQSTLVSNEKRESVFYYRQPIEKPSDQEEIPDSFFEITEHDLRQIIKSYRKAAETDAPLLTKELKEQLRESQFSKYETCIIQFHFQDAYILQSVFKPRETVGDLYNYVKFYLQNSKDNFNLYTTPPKEVLKNKEFSLIKSGLVPMSKIYVSVKAKDFCNDNIDLIIPMADEIKAQELVSKWMKTEKIMTEYVGQVTEEMVASSSRETNNRQLNIAKSSDVPKWFNRK